MKMPKYLISLFILILNIPAFAAGIFDGPYAQIGLGVASSNSDSYWNHDGAGYYRQGQTNPLAQFAVGYSHSFDNNFNISANLFYNATSDNAGGLGYSGIHSDMWKTKNIWGIVAEPGYYFNESTLGYLKLGYASASSRYDQTSAGYPGSYSSSNGLIYGAGFKEAISEHVFVGLEAYQISFSRETKQDGGGDFSNNAPNLTYGGLLLGYTFGEDKKYKAPNQTLDKGSFDGINISLGLGAASLHSDYADNGPPYPEYYQAADKGFSGNVSIGYSYAFKNRLNLASSLFYQFGSERSGNLDEWGGLYNFKVKNIWGITIEPGYNFKDDSLGYLKIGYARADSKTDYSSYDSSNGFLYGAGFKQLITANTFIGVEAYQIDFTREKSHDYYDSTNKPSLTYAGISLGYKF